MATDSSHRVIMGEKGVITFSGLFLIGSFLILAGYHDLHKSLHEFEIWPDLAMDYGVSCS